jgi:hypothetical protein
LATVVIAHTAYERAVSKCVKEKGRILARAKVVVAFKYAEEKKC